MTPETSTPDGLRTRFERVARTIDDAMRRVKWLSNAAVGRAAGVDGKTVARCRDPQHIMSVSIETFCKVFDALRSMECVAALDLEAVLNRPQPRRFGD